MNKILNLIDLLASTSAVTTPSKEGTTSVWIYVILIALVVLMLVLPMITQKKRNKEYAQMLDSLSVGDTIKTIGGVIGRVTKINEKDGQKSFILETGAKGSKTTMEFDMAAIAYIVTATNKPEAPKAEEVKEEEEKQAAPAESETAPAVKEEPKKQTKKTSTTKKSTTKKSSSKKA